MNRAELLMQMSAHNVPISVGGSAPTPLTVELARSLARTDDEVRVMDATVLPQRLREHLKDDGSFDRRKVRERSAD
jgi:hypothetical protein